MTLETYSIISGSLIFLLWAIVININATSYTKVKPKPKIKGIKLFTKGAGFSESKISKLYIFEKK